MRTAIVCSLAVLIISGVALGNPIAVDLYATFDPSGYVHENLAVFPGQVVQLYIVAENWRPGGLTAVSFKPTITGDALILDFASGSPIVTLDGSWEDGYTAYLSECTETFQVVLGRIEIFFLSTPSQVELWPHTLLGRTMADCSTPPETFEYCVTQGAGLGMMAPQMLDFCGNPVEERSWSAMKALYR